MIKLQRQPQLTKLTASKRNQRHVKRKALYSTFSTTTAMTVITSNNSLLNHFSRNRSRTKEALSSTTGTAELSQGTPYHSCCQRPSRSHWPRWWVKECHKEALHELHNHCHSALNRNKCFLFFHHAIILSTVSTLHGYMYWSTHQSSVLSKCLGMGVIWLAPFCRRRRMVHIKASWYENFDVRLCENLDSFSRTVFSFPGI